MTYRLYTQNREIFFWIASFLAMTTARNVIARNEAIQQIIMNSSEYYRSLDIKKQEYEFTR